MIMINKDLAKLDPTKVFKRPSDVLIHNELTRAEKIDILQRWAYDERELSVAEEENMLSSTNQTSILDEVNQCLMDLGINDTDQGHPPTKQG